MLCYLWKERNAVVTQETRLVTIRTEKFSWYKLSKKKKRNFFFKRLLAIVRMEKRLYYFIFAKISRSIYIHIL